MNSISSSGEIPASPSLSISLRWSAHRTPMLNGLFLPHIVKNVFTIPRYFNRDVECIRRFFRRRFRYESSMYPKFKRTMSEGAADFRLDVMVEASGFTKKDMKTLEDVSDLFWRRRPFLTLVEVY